MDPIRLVSSFQYRIRIKGEWEEWTGNFRTWDGLMEWRNKHLKYWQDQGYDLHLFMTISKVIRPGENGFKQITYLKKIDD